MSTRIENGSVIISPPNSEAPIGSQRIGIKKSSVCSYYLSNKRDEVLEVFDRLGATFFLDLSATYFFCADVIETVLKKYSHLYRDGGLAIQSGLNHIEWILNNSPEDAFSQMTPPKFLAKKKYIKLIDDSAKMRSFKAIVLGDLLEIVFSHPRRGVCVVYAMPRPDLGDSLSSENSLRTWFDSKGIKS